MSMKGFFVPPACPTCGFPHLLLTHKKPCRGQPPITIQGHPNSISHFSDMVEHQSLSYMTFHLALCLSHSVLSALVILLVPEFAKDITPSQPSKAFSRFSS